MHPKKVFSKTKSRSRKPTDPLRQLGRTDKTLSARAKYTDCWTSPGPLSTLLRFLLQSSLLENLSSSRPHSISPWTLWPIESGSTQRSSTYFGGRTRTLNPFSKLRPSLPSSRMRMRTKQYQTHSFRFLESTFSAFLILLISWELVFEDLLGPRLPNQPQTWCLGIEVYFWVSEGFPPSASWQRSYYGLARRNYLFWQRKSPRHQRTNLRRTSLLSWRHVSTK